MKNDRLEFARRYANWGVEEGKKVMFSDESHFELRFGNQNFCCRRSKGSNRFDPKFTRKRVKHPQKVMAWACFSWKGQGGLDFLKNGEMMIGVRYNRSLRTSWSGSWACMGPPTSSRMGLLATGPRLSVSGSRRGRTSSSSNGLATALT
jgi:hypothetical protein